VCSKNKVEPESEFEDAEVNTDEMCPYKAYRMLQTVSHSAIFKKLMYRLHYYCFTSVQSQMNVTSQAYPSHSADQLTGSFVLLRNAHPLSYMDLKSVILTLYK